MSLPRASFWMVAGLGQGAPTVQHLSRSAADTEARRLARAHQGVVFVVLEAISAVVKDDLKTVILTKTPGPDDDDIPF